MCSSRCLRTWTFLIACLVVVPHAMLAQTVPATAPSAPPAPSVPKVVVTLPKMPTSPGYFCLDATVTAGDKKFPLTFGLFLPTNYFARKQDRFPIVIALHNDGIQGNGGAGLTFEGLGFLFQSDTWDPRDAEKRQNLPELTLRRTAMFIGLAPQCPRGYEFDGFPVAQAISELATRISKTYRADRTRTYLTGFSYGGTFCWRMAAALPNDFAAIAPISSRAAPDPARAIQDIHGLPVYLACGTDEWAYPHCQTMGNALEQSKHPDHVFRIIQGGTHWCYASIYNDPEFWKWLFSKRSPRSTTTTQPANPSTAVRP